MNDELLPCVEITPNSAHRTSVVWLHGLGADGHDFEPIAAELALPAELGVRFVFPHAPHRAVTINGGYVMRAWYDILGPDLSHAVDEPGIHESRRRVSTLIDREVTLGIPPSRIIVAGFSQGGMIALEVAARYREPLAGVLALSTYLALPEQFPNAAAKTPIFMAHGTQDPIIPHRLAITSRETLERKGYPVEWHSYPIQHAVCLEEIRDLRAWLLARLNWAVNPAAAR
jgi:phospholipase/carboxylesterase